jgi:crotonobetainyl-CoA:carnitine CoA-transferase CaiB-like acyl-CoA transferase
MRVKINHPFEPDLSLVRNALTFSGTPITTYRHPPRLGEHTKEVLATIGYDDAKLEGLRERKVI